MAKTKKQKEYALTLKLGDQVISSSGETMLEALRELKAPPKIMCKGVLTVTVGDVSKEKLLMPARVKRLFYDNVQEVVAKQLVAGL